MSLRADLIAAARRLAPLGLSQGTSGNLSAREGRGFLITPSGLDYDGLSEDQVVWMDLDGSWRGGTKPSSEWRFHRDLMYARPEIGAIVHGHPVGATALAAHGRGITAFHYMVAIAGGEDIRCAPYATFGTQALSDHVLAAMEERKACLMAHHGMIACGADLAEALKIAVEVEALAQQFLAALQLGEPPVLSSEQMAPVLEKFRAGYGYASGPGKLSEEL